MRWATIIFVQGKSRFASCSCMYFSVSRSTALVVSSSIKILGFTARARARAMRCFWPPERPVPRSPITVSKPSESFSAKSTSAIFAKRFTSSSDISLSP